MDRAYLYIVGCNLAFRRMDHGDITLSEIRQTQNKYSMPPLIRGTKDSQSLRDKKENGGNQGLGWGCYQLTGAEFQFGKLKKSWRWTVVMVIRPRE